MPWRAACGWGSGIPMTDGTPAGRPDIRLIACDMDGTLLDSRKRLPPRLDPVLAELHRRGIRFVISSGRQYYNLLTVMQGRVEGLTYIADNGTMAFEGGRNLFADELDLGRLQQAVAAVRAVPHAHIILCGVESAYYEGGGTAVRDNARMYYERLQTVPDVTAVLGRDRICKVAVFDEGDAETQSYPALQPLSAAFRVTLSGAHWVDLSNPNACKGTALRFLQRRYGIEPVACMAFGDYLNDASMMAACGVGFAMANAHPDLKRLCGRVTQGTNDEDGVLRTLCSYLGLD